MCFVLYYEHVSFKTFDGFSFQRTLSFRMAVRFQRLQVAIRLFLFGMTDRNH